MSDGTVVSYEYNSSGVRTKKTVGNTVYEYILDGTKILKETQTVNGAVTAQIEYVYDENGSPIGCIWNGYTYFYQKNLQGDVISIVDPNCNIIVNYSYDAWGNLLSITGTKAATLGALNSIRYRSYYYDTETGFYYLNSRYYDPQVTRFLNADGIIGANGGIIGYNMFAYCNNNPIMYGDYTGNARFPVQKIVMDGGTKARPNVATDDNEMSKQLAEYVLSTPPSDYDAYYIDVICLGTLYNGPSSFESIAGSAFAVTDFLVTVGSIIGEKITKGVSLALDVASLIVGADTIQKIFNPNPLPEYVEYQSFLVTQKITVIETDDNHIYKRTDYYFSSIYVWNHTKLDGGEWYCISCEYTFEENYFLK